MEDTNRPGTVQTPPSLLAKVEASLRTYRTYIADAKTLQEHIMMLHHPEWEVRCAAVEVLSACDPQSALEPLLEALSDENCFVRVAAVCSLGRMGDKVPMDRLLLCLQDHDWQVREMAVLTLGKLGYPEIRQHLEAAMSDSSREVRMAADLALQAYDRQIQKRQPASSPIATKHAQQVTSPQSRKEREPLLMEVTRLSPEPTDQQTSMISPGSVPPLPSRKRRTPLKAFFIVAAAIFLLALTAGGIGYSWWNTTFGNPDLYQTVQQQQTDHGVTVVVTKVYADEGRTVIAYDTYAANHAQDQQFFIDDYTVTGSAPAKNEGPLQATYGDALQDGVSHFYMVVPAFLVPANVNTVTITLDIGRMLVNQSGKGKLPDVPGHWHLSFTVPFHHENNHNLPDPIHGEAIPHQ
jgi:HEAT repeats/PBS lyase HEAT-like repeat